MIFTYHFASFGTAQQLNFQILKSLNNLVLLPSIK